MLLNFHARLELTNLRHLAQYSWNWKITFKDWMHHCDQKLGVIRVHGWYFSSCTLLKHTWASCKIFCRQGDYKKHQNDLKCGDLVDLMWGCCWFCCITVILLYEREFFFWGGGAIWAYFGHLVQKIRIWALMKSNGHNINRNGLYDP